MYHDLGIRDISFDAFPKTGRQITSFIKNQLIINFKVVPIYAAADLVHELRGSALHRTVDKILARTPEVVTRCLADGVARGQEVVRGNIRASASSNCKF